MSLVTVIGELQERPVALRPRGIAGCPPKKGGGTMKKRKENRTTRQNERGHKQEKEQEQGMAWPNRETQETPKQQQETTRHNTHRPDCRHRFPLSVQPPALLKHHQLQLCETCLYVKATCVALRLRMASLLSHLSM